MIAVPAVTLPDHIEPMLARIGRPFDSAEHLFELKWDGVRAIAYVDGRGLRMHGRRRRDLAGRYPEIAALADLPDGTVLDGELVVLRDDGRPDFRAVLSRENASPANVPGASRRHPVVYVVFDLLYRDGRSLLELPLRERREQLGALFAAHEPHRCLLSDGVVGQGMALFAAARERELEGIVAKRLDAPYLPGQRGDAWQKIKPVKSVHCVVIGYDTNPAGELKSLVVATDLDGELRCVGKVGSGIGAAERAALQATLAARVVDAPVVASELRCKWVRPGIYCHVSYLETTAAGNLRAPVFEALVGEHDA